MTDQSRYLLKYLHTYINLVAYYTNLGSPEKLAEKAALGITSASWDFADAYYDVKYARTMMRQAYYRKKRSKDALLKTVRAIHRSAQKAFRHQPDVLEFLQIPRLGRPRKGETRPVRLSAQGEADLLRQGGRLAYKILRRHDWCDSIQAQPECGYALDELEVTIAEFKTAIKEHQQMRRMWRKAVAVRNKAKDQLQDWMRRVRLWIMRDALANSKWADFLICDRPLLVDRRYLTKELKEKYKRLFWQRNYRHRKKLEARAKKRAEFEALAHQARDLLTGFG